MNHGTATYITLLPYSGFLLGGGAGGGGGICPPLQTVCPPLESGSLFVKELCLYSKVNLVEMV